MGSFHCGQVGVELKRSRSLVRLAEIQSTLHEQRYAGQFDIHHLLNKFIMFDKFSPTFVKHFSYFLEINQLFSDQLHCYLKILHCV